ncbi:LysR family transcriptional regulator [Amycolatopsis sp. NPDC047767]|uniref:LysR family transcriptional regulator n=1 Tax=Amycolatopsis sp. NPDC047767 TaxID=3156765 RepID=UPI00345233DF
MSGTVDVRSLRADDLRYLLAVANTGRLVAAADALAVDHTTVSRRVRALEKTLGVRLVERGADGWELTETGRAVAEHARPIQEAVERAAKAAAGVHDDSLTGTFRITAPDGFGTAFVVPALARLRDQHPNLSVELITATRQLGLHQSGFDLAIAVGKPVASRLYTERLTDYTLDLYASDEYLARYGEPTTMDELKTHSLIFYIDSLLQVGDLDAAKLAPGMTARFTSTNILAQLEATCAGAGIGLLPKFLAIRGGNLRAVRAGQKPMLLSFTLAARRDSVTRRPVQIVRDALHDEVRSRRAELI